METLNDQSILVTGASGFLGSVIAAYFRRGGARVVGTARSQQCQSDQEVLYLDLENSSDLQLLETKGPYDAVIHCAAVLPGKISDQELISVNQKMTFNVAAWALNNKVANFLFASSCSVYGYLNKPCDELSIPQPSNMYAVSKIACEYMINAMATNTNTKICILRISAPYGPSLRAETVIKCFLNQVARNNPITLLGTGTRSQDFVYQDDVAEAFYRAVQQNAEGTFNISGNQPVSMLNLAEIILRIFGKNRDNGIIFKGIDFQESYRGSFPTTSAMHTFGFAPQVDLKEGLLRTAREWGLI